MNGTTLKDFRHAIYGCFQRAGDALFNTMDALLTEDRARSFPELSLSPHFERQWPSLYEAFEDGKIDQRQLRRVFDDFLPQAGVGSLLWAGVDTSGIARARAVTAADRSAQHVHNLPTCDKPVTYGWQFSTLVVLPETPSSWTYILDQQRVSTETTPAQVAFEQLSQLAQSRPEHTIAVLDRGYDSTWLWCQCSTLSLKGTLVRLKGNRCLYRAAPAPSGKRGAPRKDGDKLQPDDPQTHGTPSNQWQGQDAKERAIEISWWHHLHVKGARWLNLTVIRVVRPHATNTERDPRVSWFVWIGDQHTDIVQVALGYVRRFSQEHGYRFDKQALLWEAPRLRTPAQFERWSHIVAIAHNHLVLARDLVAVEFRPWENTHREPTPQQVRRGMNKLLPQLGTPARPPQPRGKSPGRAKGAKIGKAKRFPVVRKTPKLPPLIPR
ncbi:MAG: NF041680 family putative transposase [Ktedonobacteraceae bacterium]